MSKNWSYNDWQRERHIRRKEHILKSYMASMPKCFDSSDIWAVERAWHEFHMNNYESRAEAERIWALMCSWGYDCEPYWHYDYRGQLSKGKIHCSCCGCAAKTNNRGGLKSGWNPVHNWKSSDRRKVESMDEQLREYLNSEDAY